MPTTIDAAPLGHPTRDGLGIIEEHEYALVWEDRERVTLDVEDNEPLSAVIERAAEALGIPPRAPDALPLHLQFVAFNSDSPIPLRRRVTDRLTVIDENGAATWDVVDFGGTTYGQVVRSAAAGTIPGDPSRVFVVPPLWAGGGILTDWQLIILVLVSIRGALGVLADVYGAAQLVQALLSRVRRGHDAIAANEPRWMRRDGTPGAVRGMLRNRSAWSSRDVAGLLGCTVAEAEDVMSVIGYGQNPSGEWVWTAGDPVDGIAPPDDLSRLTVTITAEAEWDHSDYIDGPPINRNEVERVVERMLRAYIETGQLPPTRQEQARLRERDEQG